MKHFKTYMREKQIVWRKNFLPSIQKWGKQNGREYEYILPSNERFQNFYPPIRKSISSYIDNTGITPHTGIHNLLSSWVLCANMYWPFRNPDGYELLRGYFNLFLGCQIKQIISLELEYQDDNPNLSPDYLLGEKSGSRGSGQTSPDLAIKFTTNQGSKGILLIESKFTEHSFYSCSAYNKTKPGKPANPDKKRCWDNQSIINSDFLKCHLIAWDRKYWAILKGSLNFQVFTSLKKCPMSTACYQLFRQQSLAKGYEEVYDLAISAVAMDTRNEVLINSLCSVGLKPLPEGWRELFPNLTFLWLNHFDWVKYVKQNDSFGKWISWVDYIESRYL